MFKVNDYVIYKRDVCIILEEKIISNYEYFVLQSTIDDSLKINIPKNMSSKLLRHLNTKKDIEKLISKIKTIPLLDVNSKKLSADALVNALKFTDTKK